MTLRDEIARTLCEEVFKGHARTQPIFMDETEEKQFLRYADRILALPQIAEALALKAGFATTPEEYRSLTGHSAGKSR